MKAYIIHVSEDFERKKYIESQLKETNLDVEYILDGDKRKLSKEVLDTYFKGVNMHKKANQTSCAYKHILAYKEIVEKDEIAIILEDDIFFYKNFNLNLNKIVAEIDKNKINNFLISLEDSMLRYIGKSLRVKNQFIYPEKTGRLTGAYLIDKYAAKNILEKVQTDKMHLPIDWFHNFCAEEKRINIYWSQPTICCQKSIDGSFTSSIGKKKSNFFRKYSFKLQRIYKRLLYQFR